jgi:hypothetical protein
MRSKTCGVAWTAAAIAVSFAAYCSAEIPSFDATIEAIAQETRGQQEVELAVRVVDPDGKPVSNAKVTPWALRSSQGHGWWRMDDKRSGVDPRDVLTDAEGNAAVRYPYFRDLQERIRTTSVSLQIDHPDFAYTGDLHIDAPLETPGPYVVTLIAGIPLEIHPKLDGDSTDLDHVFALWSDGRSWQAGAAPTKVASRCEQRPAGQARWRAGNALQPDHGLHTRGG